ncbi:MAG: FAD/NAD(P)-binding oxidoreductase [Salibacteraceae bacterium]
MHTVIIGNGIAGVTCARHLRKGSDESITIISGESDYFYSRTALMYIYMGHMKYEHTKPYEDWFWKKNKIDLRKAWVERVDYQKKCLFFEDGESMLYDRLVIATGSKPNKFGWDGEDLEGVQGLYSLQDLTLLEKNTHSPRASNKKVQHAVIVGGGLIGVELAEMLMTRDIKISFLIREKHFWGNVLPPDDGGFVARHIRKHGVELLFETELSAIIPDENGRVCAIETSKGSRITCEFVGLTAGVSPNIDFLRSNALDVDRGVLIDNFFQTNQLDVYAIGDCAQFSDPPKGVRAINQVWYTGRIMGETLAQNMLGKKVAYRPGPWFNSAKFFDLEYQTYGEVSSTPTEHVESFFWVDKNDERAIKVQFDINTNKFLGINAYGVRFRHEYFDQKLRKGELVSDVIAGFRKADFDPEFQSDFHKGFIAYWNSTYPDFKVPGNRKYILF